MSIRKKILSARRGIKQLIIAINDFSCFLIGNLVVLFIFQDLFSVSIQENILKLSLTPVFGVLVLSLTGVYRSIVRYIDFSGIYILLRSLYHKYLNQ